MAFPTGQNKLSLIQMMGTIQSQVIGLKNYAVSLQSMIANPVSINQLLDFLQVLRQTTEMINSGINTPGLSDFAKSQFYDPTVDLVTEAQNLLTAISTVKSAVIAAIPVDANNYILKDALQPDGSVLVVSLQPAHLTGLSDPLQQLASAID